MEKESFYAEHGIGNRSIDWGINGGTIPLYFIWRAVDDVDLGPGNFGFDF
jgi:hypothetical protein